MRSFYILLLVASTYALPLEGGDRQRRDESKVRIFEGDIMMPEEEIRAAENGMDPTEVGRERGLSKSEYRKWPGGIVPYILDSEAGFWHEQSRPDRDEYVEIIWDKIAEGQGHNFHKYSTGTMHYGKHDFAKLPWQVTIRPKKPGAKIGHKRRLSPLDIKQMNLFYSCNKK